MLRYEVGDLEKPETLKSGWANALSLVIALAVILGFGAVMGVGLDWGGVWFAILIVAVVILIGLGLLGSVKPQR